MEPTRDETTPEFPYHPYEETQPVLTTAKAIGIVIAVVCAVFGLLALAAFICITILFNSSGSNK